MTRVNQLVQLESVTFLTLLGVSKIDVIQIYSVGRSLCEILSEKETD